MSIISISILIPASMYGRVIVLLPILPIVSERDELLRSFEVSTASMDSQVSAYWLHTYLSFYFTNRASLPSVRLG